MRDFTEVLEVTTSVFVTQNEVDVYSNSLPTLTDREKSLIENMNEEDNPVLVIITLKHF